MLGERARKVVILVCRVSVLDLVNKMRGERVDCLCFREKSTILSSLLSRAAESDQPASNQTVITINSSVTLPYLINSNCSNFFHTSYIKEHSDKPYCLLTYSYQQKSTHG